MCSNLAQPDLPLFGSFLSNAKNRGVVFFIYFISNTVASGEVCKLRLIFRYNDPSTSVCRRPVATLINMRFYSNQKT